MTAPADSLVGTKLGEYQIGDILEQDSGGTLYRAEHAQLHRARACLVLDRELAQHAAVVESFLQTARLISRSRHKQLVDIFDSGALPDGRPYYVMELLSGQTLDRLLADGQNPLSLAERLSIGRQICVGLAAAHATGVIHGLLTPRAVFVVKRPGEVPAVKLTRFGFVRDPSAAELVYASPELISGAKVAERSDVYAAGLLLYELCTGAPPFRGDPESLRVAHLELKPPALLAGLPGMPSGLAAVIERALAKPPGERYANGQELLTALDQTVSLVDAPAYLSQVEQRALGVPVRVTVLRKVRGWLQGRRVLLGALGLAGLVVGLGIFWWARRPPPVVARTAYTMVQLRDLALQTLQAGLRDRDPLVRQQALRGLGQSPDVRYRSLIEPLLDDPTPAVREQAATVLGFLGARAAAPVLRAHADQATDRGVQVACAEALLKLGEPAGKLYLKAVVGGAGGVAAAQQARAALVLAEYGEPAEQQPARAQLAQLLSAKPAVLDGSLITSILIRRAQRGDSQAQDQLASRLPEQGALDMDGVAVAAALLRLERPGARERLRDRAAQPGPSQVAAATALCEADDPTFIGLLRDVLASGTPSDQLTAVSGIGTCGDKTDGEELAALLQAPKLAGTQRQAMAGAMLRLASSDPQVLAEQGLSWAEVALTDDNWTVRESAAALLGDSDPQRLLDRPPRPAPVETKAPVEAKAKPAKDPLPPAPAPSEHLVSLLRGAVADKNRNVRVAALRSIGKLEARLHGGSNGVELSKTLHTMLVQRADQGEPAERVVAAATLSRAGDNSRHAVLVDALHAPEAAVRKVAIQESIGDKTVGQKELEPLLKDPDFDVRFHAAQALAQRLTPPPVSAEPPGKKQRRVKNKAKDKELKERDRLAKDAAVVLREAVRRGGSEGVQAYGLLDKLGEKLPTEQTTAKTSVADLLSSPEVLTRLTALEEVLRLPVAEAVPLLLKAARDPDAIMRFRVAEAASELPMPTQDPKVAPGLPVLRLLVTDDDVAVRSRALALYQSLRPAREESIARAPSGERKDHPPAPPTPPATKPTAASVPTVARPMDGGTSDAGGVDGGAADAGRPAVAEEKPDRGFVQVEPGSVVPFQLDGKEYKELPEKPIAVGPGRHPITFSGGQRTVTVTTGETTSVKLLPSQAESLFNKGAAAARASDYRTAAKQLERAAQLCQKNHDERATCAKLGGELAYELGRVYENLNKVSDAMTEYQRAAKDGGGNEQANAQAAMQRLGRRLGRLNLYKLVDGECRLVEVWMPPGSHLVSVGGGERKPVDLSAGETVELRTCP